jgi:hypothetical protein
MPVVCTKLLQPKHLVALARADGCALEVNRGESRNGRGAETLKRGEGTTPSKVKHQRHTSPQELLAGQQLQLPTRCLDYSRPLVRARGR